MCASYLIARSAINFWNKSRGLLTCTRELSMFSVILLVSAHQGSGSVVLLMKQYKMQHG